MIVNPTFGPWSSLPSSGGDGTIPPGPETNGEKLMLLFLQELFFLLELTSRPRRFRGGGEPDFEAADNQPGVAEDGQMPLACMLLLTNDRSRLDHLASDECRAPGRLNRNDV